MISSIHFSLIENSFLGLISSLQIHIRHRHILNRKPKLKNPEWLPKKYRSDQDNDLTKENKEFVKEIISDKYVQSNDNLKVSTTNTEWTPHLKRTGVIARKIGVYPLWRKDGSKVMTTLLQVLDNHVIKHHSSEQYNPAKQTFKGIKYKKECLIIGAEATNPADLTKEYCGIFKESSVIPKQILARFFVSDKAVLPLGFCLNVMHFQVGQYVDIRGKTIDRGFQGVMKRHGFKGMPASHGATKTHRRGGNIGGGGEKGRVWPGTKMPGWMGNRYRIAKGLRIYRINTKYNVMWVCGQAIPGDTNSIVYIYDTVLPLRTPQKPVPFPTYLNLTNEDIPEDIFDEEIQQFFGSTISFK